MIVRIMGEGQMRLDDAAVDELNRLDEAVGAAVERDDQEAFESALNALLAKTRSLGEALPHDAIEPSDLILPREGATIEEVRELLADDGLIPG